MRSTNSAVLWCMFFGVLNGGRADEDADDGGERGRHQADGPLLVVGPADGVLELLHGAVVGDGLGVVGVVGWTNVYLTVAST